MPVELEAVLLHLSSIDSPQNLRSTRQPGDLDGKFDRWFDGGAMKVVTGWNEYHFADGTLAVVPTTPTLQIEMRLPSGVFVTVNEQRHAPPNFELLDL